MSEDKTPLISSRSPSMRRAREEWKHPSETADPDVVAALCRVVEVERAAAAAYRAAGRDDDAARHEQRAEKVAAIAGDLGAAAPDAAEVDPRVVPVSATEIGYLPDAEVAAALERDERAVSSAYDAALGRELGDDVARRLRAIR